MKDINQLKAEILRLTALYAEQKHASFKMANSPGKTPWKPGNPIPYAGRVFDEDEVKAAVESALDFWLTLGTEGACMEEELADFLGVRSSLLVNSGSSANLIAISTLTSHRLQEKRRVLPGDEIITVAAGFPTTVAPIVQVGAVPVFLDADPSTGNVDCSYLEEAYTPGKTKAVIFAHALGNPFNIQAVLRFCRKYDLWLIEDNCDALGSTYSMPKDLAVSLGFSRNSPGLDDGENRIIRWTGAWGDMSTQSFYPPHHITMGEGGAVNIVNSSLLKSVAESLRDWGRDCWCPSGTDNTCNKRFGWKLGELPQGYDHKYTYSHLGYNLKPLDLQAAIGRIQLRRLKAFIEARERNWKFLRDGLAGYEHILRFTLPSHATARNADGSFKWDETGCKTTCSWFGFHLSVKEIGQICRTGLAEELDKHQIGNRMFFGGNLVRQPAFVQLKQARPDSMRVVGDLKVSDSIMHNSLFLGTYPGLTHDMMNWEIEVIKSFLENNL